MHKIVTPKREKPSKLTLLIQNGNRNIKLFHSAMAVLMPINILILVVRNIYIYIYTHTHTHTHTQGC